DGTKGLVWIEKYKKPRTINYEFNKETLSFESTVVGEQYIPEFTSLEIYLPAGSVVTSAKPRPIEFEDRVVASADKLTWQGYISLREFNLRFERKESLFSEVNSFFKTLQDTAIGWLTSKEGMIITGAVVVLFISYLILQRRKQE
ncbi:MAG: hypothetical protein QW112_02570, partial [Candidatus Micrarchaeia archaeon]